MHFFEEDFIISKVTLCMNVSANTARRVHRDRPAAGVVYYENGGGRFDFSDGSVFNVREGEIIFLPQGSDYRAAGEENGSCRAINFQTSPPLSLPPEILRPRDRTGVLSLFRESETAWKEKKEGWEFRCLSLLYALFARLKQESSLGYGDSGKAARIAPAVEAIRSSYSSPLTVAGLARLCGTSPEYFRALFKQKFGVSPLKYLNRLRLERAAELLCTGLYSVTQAARECGFADLSSFSREFRRFSGVSPTRFMERE